MSSTLTFKYGASSIPVNACGIEICEELSNVLVLVTRAIFWLDLSPGHPPLSLNMLLLKSRDWWKTPDFRLNFNLFKMLNMFFKL